jgi:aminopeptidase YwaD
VLFYFTGVHSDYHRPTDDAEKINYNGEAAVVQHILSVITNAGKQKEKLLFTKTRETMTGTSSRFSVTIGVMPDYTFNGPGLRIDAVSDGRPAQKAGLRSGDIITALGDYKVSSIEGYMEALGKFKKGEKTKLSYTRNNSSFSTNVEF